MTMSLAPLRWYFGLFCHQMPDRCLPLTLDSNCAEAMPICARCAGLYVGVGVVAAWLLVRAAMRRRPWAPLGWVRASLVPLALCLVDGLTGASHTIGLPGELANQVRFLLGYGAGVSLAMLLTGVLVPFFPERRAPVRHDGPPLALLAAVVLVPLFSMTGTLVLPGAGAALSWTAAWGMLSFHVLALVAGAVVARRCARGAVEAIARRGVGVAGRQAVGASAGTEAP